MKSKNTYRNYMGIDIAKKTFDVCVHASGKVCSFPNTEEGFKTFKQCLKPSTKTLIVLESTGGYEKRSVQFLQKHRRKVAVVNPRQIRDFAKALGRLAKTDRIDATVIAHFGAAVQPHPKALESEKALLLKELQERRSQLVEMMIMENNRLLSASATLRPFLEASVKALQVQLKSIEARLAEQVAGNPEWAAKKARLKAIQGVGEATATMMVSALPELGQATHKEIAALVGVVPFNRDSGQFKGERRIFGGRAHVRAALYMATLVGVQCNPMLLAMESRRRG